MTEPTLSTEELFLIFYCIVDDLYSEVAPDWIRFRRGTDQMDMTDAEIITLFIMHEGPSNDSELSFHGWSRRTISTCFRVSLAALAIIEDAKI